MKDVCSITYSGCELTGPGRKIKELVDIHKQGKRAIRIEKANQLAEFLEERETQCQAETVTRGQ